MKRKEEREKASKNRADQYSHPAEWNECYRHFKEGAEWADKTMIDKACEWIKQHLYDEAYLFRDNEGTWVDTDLVVDDLKKAMNE